MSVSFMSYKIRLYPTKEQENAMFNHIRAARFIWNLMIEKQRNKYLEDGSYISKFDMIRLLTSVKSETLWLYDVSNYTLQGACSDVDTSYQRFFKKITKIPNFKSRKRSKNSFCVIPNETYIKKKSGLLHLQKIGDIKFKTDFSFPIGRGKMKLANSRIIFEKSGKWFIYFAMERENQASVLTNKPMGIDLGIKETMVVAYGNESITFHNINKSRKVRELKKRIRNLQRVISRKYEANRVGKKYIKTNNIIKLENKLIKLHARLNGIRHNYIHQCTHKLISLLPCRVVMEDLNVMGMMKNKHLSKAIQEQCFYEIIRQMKYKCEWNGIPFIQVDRFYPSSKTCSCCGAINKRLTLSDRIFICPECGFTIDRDYQAALNLMRYEV